MRYFVIRPVRGVTKEQEFKINRFVTLSEQEGHTVHDPARDTNQIDDTGFRICVDNALAITTCDQVWLFWNKDSKGSLFDLGVAFGLGKPLYLINPEDIEPVEGKSFENMVCYWAMVTEQMDMEREG